MLVARVRASTQNPPIPSGKRVIFRDGAGLIELAFFEDSHDSSAHTVFHSRPLVVRGTVEPSTPRLSRPEAAGTGTGCMIDRSSATRSSIENS